MKVADTFPYFSAKTPILVTEGVGKVLFDGDRNEMPEELEELTATRCEFLFNERKFWVSVEAQDAHINAHIKMIEWDVPDKKPYEPYRQPPAQCCDNCAFLDLRGYQCQIKRERIDKPNRAVCCVYSRRNGTVVVDDPDYQFQIVARRAFLDPSGIMEDSNVTCADCAWYVKEKGRCWMGVRKECNDDTVCGLGKKRSDYE